MLPIKHTAHSLYISICINCLVRKLNGGSSPDLPPFSYLPNISINIIQMARICNAWVLAGWCVASCVAVRIRICFWRAEGLGCGGWFHGGRGTGGVMDRKKWMNRGVKWRAQKERSEWESMFCAKRWRECGEWHGKISELLRGSYVAHRATQPKTLADYKLAN